MIEIRFHWLYYKRLRLAVPKRWLFYYEGLKKYLFFVNFWLLSWSSPNLPSGCNSGNESISLSCWMLAKKVCISSPVRFASIQHVHDVFHAGFTRCVSFYGRFELPHLLTPVITDMTDASNGLRWCVAEMDRRYKLMSEIIKWFKNVNVLLSDLLNWLKI